MLLALSLAFALAFFFFLVMLIFLARRSSGEEVKRRLDVFRDVEPVREEEENPDDLKRIPLYQRTIGRAFTGMAAFFAQFAPSSIPKLMEHRIMVAGKQGIWKVRPVVGLWFLSMALFGILAFYYTTKTPVSTVQGLCTIGAASFLGRCFPLVFLTISFGKGRTSSSVSCRMCLTSFPFPCRQDFPLTEL